MGFHIGKSKVAGRGAFLLPLPDSPIRYVISPALQKGAGSTAVREDRSVQLIGLPCKEGSLRGAEATCPPQHLVCGG